MHEMAHLLLVASLCIGFTATVRSQVAINNYNPKYGAFVGRLDGGQAAGDVYIASLNTLVIAGLQFRGSNSKLPNNFLGQPNQQPIFFKQPVPIAHETQTDAGVFVSPEANPAAGGISLATGTELKADGQNSLQSGQDVVLRLPSGMSLANIRSLQLLDKNNGRAISGVLALNPRAIAVPQPVTLAPLTQNDHDVSSGPITVLNAKQIRIEKLTYDGQAPDAFFWVGKSASGDPNPQGQIVPYPGAQMVKLAAFRGQTVELTLPGDLAIKDINYLAVWCRQYEVNFGAVKIPSNIVVPPAIVVPMSSMAMKTSNAVNLPNFANCERYSAGGRSIDISWFVQTTPPYIYVQMETPLAVNEYMAFGISGDTQGVLMKGGDVAVAFIDANDKGYAIDYSLDDYSQCTGTTGACPDTELGGNNDVEFLSSQRQNGVARVVWRKPLDRGDRKDIVIDVNNPMYTIWSIGPLNSKMQVSYHNAFHAMRTDDTRVVFNRKELSHCPARTGAAAQEISLSDATILPAATGAVVVPGSSAMSKDAPWKPAQLFGDSDDRKFLVVIGPAGGRRGYSGITGIQSWGIAFYVNGRLIPEIILQRGIEYEFQVYTGNDESNSAKYHPVYITTDPEGGFGQKTPQEQAAERYLAGIERTAGGSYIPTALGPLCELKTPLGTNPESFSTFEAFNKTLTLQCKDSAGPGMFPARGPGILRFRPDARTPDIAYYQCYQHRNLGWKILVVNDLNMAKRQFLGVPSADAGSQQRRPGDQANSAHKKKKNVAGGLVLGVGSLAAMAMKKTKV